MVGGNVYIVCASRKCVNKGNVDEHRTSERWSLEIVFADYNYCEIYILYIYISALCCPEEEGASVRPEIIMEAQTDPYGEKPVLCEAYVAQRHCLK